MVRVVTIAAGFHFRVVGDNPMQCYAAQGGAIMCGLYTATLQQLPSRGVSVYT